MANNRKALSGHAGFQPIFGAKSTMKPGGPGMIGDGVNDVLALKKAQLGVGLAVWTIIVRRPCDDGGLIVIARPRYPSSYSLRSIVTSS